VFSIKLKKRDGKSKKENDYWSAVRVRKAFSSKDVRDLMGSRDVNASDWVVSLLLTRRVYGI
jgi:hypothetical protein